MAIVQISQIKHRRGTNENLPQLASAELGWSIDTRQLYIGNGTLAEGAPEVGNTEILTEHSVIPGIPQVVTSTLTNNTANAAITGSDIPALQLGATVDYTITRNYEVRKGTIQVGHNGTTVSYDDEYMETSDVGITLAYYNVGSNIARLFYSTTNSGFDANIQFAISTF